MTGWREAGGGWLDTPRAGLRVSSLRRPEGQPHAMSMAMTPGVWPERQLRRKWLFPPWDPNAASALRSPPCPPVGPSAHPDSPNTDSGLGEMPGVWN